MTNNDIIKKIHRAANVGLWGTLFFGIVAVAEHYLDQYVFARQITANDYTRRLCLVGGLVLAVVDIAMVLLEVRRRTPIIRQCDGVGERLERYLALVRLVYLPALVVAMLVTAAVIITHENTMIMLLLLLFVTLMLSYPNMYKMKNDLGFGDGEMKELFGEQYVTGSQENRGDAERIDKPE